MSTNDLHNRHRRLREYFTIEQQSLRAAVHAVSPTITGRDADRVFTWLAANIDTYRGSDRRGRPAFKKWAVIWIRFVTRIILIVREMTPALIAAAEAAVPGLPPGDYDLAAKRVENHVLGLLNTDVHNLLQWASHWAVYEARGLAEWQKWGQCPIIRRCVYKGFWRCLNQCGDLGLGGTDNAGRNPVVEALTSDVWLWAHEYAGTLAQGPVPVGARLMKKAYWRAREWKTDQLRDAEGFITLEAADRMKFYDEPTRAKCDDEAEGRQELLELLHENGFDDPDAVLIEENHQEEDVPLAA